MTRERPKRVYAPNKKLKTFQNFALKLQIYYQKDKLSAGFKEGPNAKVLEHLGNLGTILGDPRHPEMQKKLNLKIKYREGFRPVAPECVLAEKVVDYFDLEGGLAHHGILLIAPVQQRRWKEKPADYDDLELYQELYRT